MDPQNFVESAIKQFKYYQLLGTAAFDQLAEEQLFYTPAPESNSIAIIVNHMSGNMASRWTDFLTSDGEKEWRHRDKEFEDVIKDREELLTKWNAGWELVFHALEQINEDNFDQLVYIRNQGHTIVEAVNRQLCHYAYHVGQIVYLGKMIQGEEWKSLSIPKGNSNQYNSEKFNKPKERGHFTDE